MINFSKYLPYIFAGALFFVGRLSAPKPDKELLNKYKTERAYHLRQIDQLNQSVVDLTGASASLTKKMHEDSLKFSLKLQANNAVILKLKNDYEKISLRTATHAQLDSVLTSLYPN